jgi:hypothetical protein
MNAIEFKSALKEIKSNLVGLTIQFCLPKSVAPYQTLNDFGHAVLNAEANCNTFHVNQVWTSEGVKRVSSIAELIELFKTATIDAVSFSGRYSATTLAESIKLGGSLD